MRAAGESPVEVVGMLKSVDVLTEQLLLLAADAVEAASEAAPGPKPNGKARLRLLVALVAAAMGSPASFGKPEAEKIGKRMTEQVKTVRARPARAAAKAVQDRKAARAAVASDAALAAGLPALLARIDEQEQATLARYITETYDGFWEIAPPPPPAKDEQQQLHAATDAGPPLPGWLRAKVGAGGFQWLQDNFAGGPADWPATEADTPGPMAFHWLAMCVKHTGEHAEEMLQLAETHAAERERIAERDREVDAELHQIDKNECIDMREECIEMRAELERAKGREEGLHYALQRAYGCKCMQL